MFRLLFADGFNVQQMLATGVIFGGIGFAVAAGQSVKRQMEERKAAAKASGQPARLGGLYVRMALALASGLVLVFAGVAWRAASQTAR